jgi:hypothetical protein
MRSKDLWNLDLSIGLPRVLSKSGVVAIPGELSSTMDFLRREFPTFAESLPLTAEDLAAKTAFFLNTCDFIELRHSDVTVGAIIGEPYDWSSYYVRVYALSRAYQTPALTRRFVRECLMTPLSAAGVKRVFADSSPTNVPMCRGLSEDGFFATGTNLSERYGPMVRYTKFLCRETEQAFVSKFSGTAPLR